MESGDFRSRRRSGVSNSDIDPDLRGEHERDLDRLLYTYYFRRLAEITQVSSYSDSEDDRPIDRPLLHNRLTHSLKVGQVGRRIVQYLRADPNSEPGIGAAGGIDPNVVQAAGYAHDIGHPPFGHIGENVLDRFGRRHGLSDGFEGNAQTFRILTKLTRHFPTGARELVIGVDLTHAATAACVKYPWPRGADGKRWRKFGFYADDSEAFNDIVSPLLPAPQQKTLEASIMDWADDITYAVHDLEDFSLAELVPLSSLRHVCENPEAPLDRRRYTPINQAEWSRFWDYAQTSLREAGRDIPSQDARQRFASYAAEFPRDTRGFDEFDDAVLQRLCSRIITDATNATTVTPDGQLDIEPEVRSAVDLFKQLTWCYVIENHQLASIQAGQAATLDRLLEELLRLTESAFALHRYDPWDEKQERPRTKTPDEMQASSLALPPRLAGLVWTALRAAHLQVRDTPDRRDILCRSVIDYAASLREREVKELHERFLGMG